jgi:hypothetical protein
MGDIHNQLLELANKHLTSKDSNYGKELDNRVRNGNFDEVLDYFRRAPAELLPRFEVTAILDNRDYWWQTAEVLLARGILPFNQPGSFYHMPEQRQQRLADMLLEYVEARIARQLLSTTDVEEITRFLKSPFNTSPSDLDSTCLGNRLLTLQQRLLSVHNAAPDQRLALAILDLDILICFHLDTSEHVYQRACWRLELLRCHPGLEINELEKLRTRLLTKEHMLLLRGRVSRQAERYLLVYWMFDRHAPTNRKRRRPMSDSGLHWQPWHDYYQQNPDRFNPRDIDDFWLNYRMWPIVSADVREKILAEWLRNLALCSSFDRATVYQMLDHILSEQPPTAAILQSAVEEPRAVRHLLISRNDAWKSQLLAPLLQQLKTMAEYSYSSKKVILFRKSLNSLIRQDPQPLADASADQLIAILPLLDNNIFTVVLPASKKACSQSSSKALVKAWAKVANHIPLQSIADCWLIKPNKNLCKLAADVLLEHCDPGNIQLLTELLARYGDKLTINDRSRVEDHILNHEYAIQPPTSATGNIPEETSKVLTRLENDVSQVAVDKRVLEFATPQLLSLLAPLSDHAGTALLGMALEAKEMPLPPLAVQLLEQLDEQQHLSFCEAMVQLWQALQGHHRFDWMLLFARHNPHERITDLFREVIEQWHNEVKGASNRMLEYLIERRSETALLHTLAIRENRKIRNQLAVWAGQALARELRQQKLDFWPLMEQQTASSDLGSGLNPGDEMEINIGTRKLTVHIEADLSLRFVNPQGKLSRSLPKPKDPDELADWQNAKEQVATLKNRLLAITKQQASRWQIAVQTDVSWPQANWRQLYLHHPTLRRLAQRQIWADESGHSFRIAEDFTLLNVHDEPYQPGDNLRIHLWHPAQSPSELQAWCDCLADYEITQIVDQLNLPTQLPTPDRWLGSKLLMTPQTTLPQSAIRAQLIQFGYVQNIFVEHDQDTWIWWIPWIDLEVHMTINNSMYGHSDRPVTPHLIKVIQHGETLEAIPVALQATLKNHIDTLLAAAASMV